MFSLLSILSLALWVAFALVALVFLLRVYGRTEMTSILWLIAAVIAWPLLIRGFSMVMPMIVRSFSSSRGLGYSSVSNIYGTIYLFESLIGGALIAVAALQLERELTARMLPSQPAPPATL